jgi:hypothetical protein
MVEIDPLDVGPGGFGRVQVNPARLITPSDDSSRQILRTFTSSKVGQSQL